MSSALDCDDNVENSPGNEDNMHRQSNWLRWAVDLPLAGGYQRDASGLGPWRYCTANAFLTGQIVQRATGPSVDKYIEDRILRPLGITQWNWSYSPSHETMTGGGLELRSQDWAKIASMLANKGRWQGRQIVAEVWIDALFTVRRASRELRLLRIRRNLQNRLRPAAFLVLRRQRRQPNSSAWQDARGGDLHPPKLQRPRLEQSNDGAAGKIRSSVFALFAIGTTGQPRRWRASRRGFSPPSLRSPTASFACSPPLQPICGAA